MKETQQGLWGQTGPTDHVCIKTKTSFKAKLGKSSMEKVLLAHMLTFQSAAMCFRTAQSVKRWSLSSLAAQLPSHWISKSWWLKDFISPVQSMLALRVAQVVKHSKQCPGKNHTIGNSVVKFRPWIWTIQQDVLKKITQSLTALQ
jgi:hypothetical protein